MVGYITGEKEMKLTNEDIVRRFNRFLEENQFYAEVILERHDPDYDYDKLLKLHWDYLKELQDATKTWWDLK